MNSTNISPIFQRNNYNPELYKFSFKNSREMTVPEQLLWFNILKGKQLMGYKFIKQKIFNNYIVDFYCSELLLVIELDGNSHDRDFDADRIRDNYFERIGVKVLRVTNMDVKKNLDGVRVYLEEYIKSCKMIRISSPM
jgi:very-short-patch-repair endonuclease